jgi:signal transduction histidine kinase
MTTVALVRWCRGHSEALLTAATLLIMVLAGVPGDRRGIALGWELLLIVLAWLPLTVRTVWPMVVVVVVVTVDTVHIAVAGHGHPASAMVPAATMLALYTVSSRHPARVAWCTAAVTAAVQVTVAALGFTGIGSDLLYLNWALVATALGRLIQERRERIAAAEQRAEAAERTKQAEARRQVTAERMRIAHELHDVLAHHIAVVNAQAGVAQYLLRTDPNAADKALTGIAANTRAALDELRATLGLLRAERGDAESDDGRAPAPSAEQLDTLVEGFTDAGMLLTVETRGAPRPLSGPADLARYRMAQEALTNASKHAPGSAVRLDLDWSEAGVTLTVTNTKPATTQAAHASALVNEGTGHGLLGMRERATAAGGTLSVGPTTDGGYQVTAQLPVLVTDSARISGRPSVASPNPDETSSASAP